MKFIADAMLGRLARWLRLMGIDTLYYPDITDQRLLKLAMQQERFILTRDTHFKGMGIKDCLFIDSDDTWEQISQVIKDLRLSPSAGRCANCNGLLKDVDRKEEIADRIPEYVYLNFNHFQKCSHCGNVYWEGSHYRRLRKRLDEIIKHSEGPRNCST
jgi:uncharacterized protein with PIN domain